MIHMATNVLANGVEIEGVLEFSGDLEINCKVNGEVKSDQGNLVINKDSDIKGDVKASNLTVHGKVDGAVTAASCKFAETADVKGDVAYKTLEVKPGAKLVGSMKIMS